MLKILQVVLINIIAASLVSNVYAENQRIDKLARGAVNVVTAPLEIQKQSYEYWKLGNERTKHVSVWIFSGFVKGHVNMVSRLGSGLWDVLTFPFPLPDNYEPLMKPDYVYEIKEVD